MTKIQNSKLPMILKREQTYDLVIDYWDLRFICNLVLVICYFRCIRVRAFISKLNPCIIRFLGSRQSILQSVDTILRQKGQQF